MLIGASSARELARLPLRRVGLSSYLVFMGGPFIAVGFGFGARFDTPLGSLAASCASVAALALVGCEGWLVHKGKGVGAQRPWPVEILSMLLLSMLPVAFGAEFAALWAAAGEAEGPVWQAVAMAEAVIVALYGYMYWRTRSIRTT